MKSKTEIIEYLNILRVRTDPNFEPEKDTGFHFTDKNLSKVEKLKISYEISILKWVLTDYEYDDNDMKKSNNDEDLTWLIKEQKEKLIDFINIG